MSEASFTFGPDGSGIRHVPPSPPKPYCEPCKDTGLDNTGGRCAGCKGFMQPFRRKDGTRSIWSLEQESRLRLLAWLYQQGRLTEGEVGVLTPYSELPSITSDL